MNTKQQTNNFNDWQRSRIPSHQTNLYLKDIGDSIGSPQRKYRHSVFVQALFFLYYFYLFFYKYIIVYLALQFKKFSWFSCGILKHVLNNSTKQVAICHIMSRKFISSSSMVIFTYQSTIPCWEASSLG